MEDQEKMLVLYDGDCELCKRSVWFIREHGGEEKFGFIPMQSAAAAPILVKFGYPVDYRGSVLLVDHDRIFSRSDAVFEILQQLESRWSVLSRLKWIPRPLRDFFYKIISHLRYRKFVQRMMKCKDCRL